MAGEILNISMLDTRFKLKYLYSKTHYKSYIHRFTAFPQKYSLISFLWIYKYEVEIRGIEPLTS